MANKRAPSLAQLEQALKEKTREVDVLHRITDSISNTLDLEAVLKHIVEIVVEVTRADACLLYLLSDGQDELILRASKNPHPKLIGRITIGMGEGITGWVAKHRKPVAVARNASKDPRFQAFRELPEDTFEAFLSVPVVSRDRLVGVINLQHRLPHMHTRREVKLISMIGFLIGAEIEMARLETEVNRLSEQLETRKLVERAKGILQRELGLDEQQAYLTLQKQSRQRRRSMKEVAEAIVLAEEVKRSPRSETEMISPIT